MEEKATHNVIVHKAALQLQDGETLSMFSCALGDALRDYLNRKLNLGKTAGMWMAEVGASKVVANVYNYSSDTSSSSWSKYYSVAYERDKEGKFSFDDAQEVKPVTTYVPAGKLPNVAGQVTLKKSADGMAERWAPVVKSMWSDVL